MEYSQSLSPLNTQRLLAMAVINLGFRRLSSVTTQFGRALEIYPELERAKVGLARCHAEAGRHEKAQAIVRTMADHYAVVSELNLKGVMLAKAGYFKEAVSLYKKALASSSDLRLDAVIYYNMALRYCKVKDSSSAEKAVKRSVAADPEFRKAANLKRRIEKRVFSPTKNWETCQCNPRDPPPTPAAAREVATRAAATTAYSPKPRCVFSREHFTLRSPRVMPAGYA